MSGEMPESAKDYSSIPILEMHGKEFKLKFDVFEEIFDNVRNLPVAIISVAGPFRKGKSFILNLLAHYLLENQSPNWYKDGNRKLNNVFGFRGGIERDTIGIHITKTPFMLKDKYGKEVAVFLMDTQGMFDMQTRAKDCSVIFALSTLLSSVQIYNLSENINESDLQHLQVFTNHAKYIADTKRHVNSSTSPFQGLLFLLRNWEQLDYPVGFKGGAKYLRWVMEGRIEENTLVRRNLKDSFTEVCCALMPRPGTKISTQGKTRTDVYLSDIDSTFMNEVDALAKYLFEKENLVVKKLNGCVLTGEGLIDLVIEYTKILSSGKMPKDDTLLQSSERVSFLGKIKQLETEYKINMQKRIGNAVLDPIRLNELHSECLDLARKQFLEHDVLEKEEESKAILEQMNKNIMIQFFSLSACNSGKMKNIAMLIDEQITAAGEVYYRELEKFASGQWVEDLSSPSAIATKKANSAFEKSTMMFDKRWVNERKNKLQPEKERKHKEFEIENELRGRVTKQAMSLLLAKSHQKYQELMKKAMQDENVDITAAHDDSILAALTVFNDSVVGKDTNYKADKEKKLTRELLEQYYVFQKRHDEEAKQIELEKILQRARKEYEDHVKQVLGEEYLTESELHSVHDEARTVIMATVTNVVALGCNESFVQLCKHKVAELLEEELKCLLDKNNCAKLEAENQLVVNRKALAMDYYEEMMHDEYVDNEELRKKHGEAKERALKRFSHFNTNRLKAFEQNMNELKEDTERHFQMNMRRNSKRGELIRQKLVQFYEKMTVDYLDKMYEVTRKRYSNNNTLHEMHESFKAAVIHEIKTTVTFENIQQETISICCAILEESYEQVKNAPNNDGQGGKSGFVMNLGAAIGAFIRRSNRPKTIEQDTNASCFPSVIYLRSLNIGEKLENI